GQLFEDLGVTYIGPINGHDLRALQRTFQRALQLPDPVLVHVRTQKGRGYAPAVADQVNFHGAALPPMTLVPARAPGLNGEGEGEARLSDAQAAAARKKPPSYSAVMADELVAIAAEDPRVVAITAAMPTGTGLHRFQAADPERFLDVGIFEPRALAQAA